VRICDVGKVLEVGDWAVTMLGVGAITMDEKLNNPIWQGANGEYSN
jgi:hypothetical protein